MDNYVTHGIWNYKDEKFQKIAKIYDSQLDSPALTIHPPQTEQQVHKALRVLEVKGLLKFEDGHYTVTPKGERLHNTLHQALLGLLPQEK